MRIQGKRSQANRFDEKPPTNMNETSHFDEQPDNTNIQNQ